MVKHTQTIRRILPTNYFSVCDHFVGLTLKGLTWMANVSLQVTEVGTMNIFMYWVNENGGRKGIFGLGKTSIRLMSLKRRNRNHGDVLMTQQTFTRSKLTIKTLKCLK